MRLVSGDPRERVLGRNGTSGETSIDSKRKDIGELVRSESPLRRLFPDPKGAYPVEKFYKAAGVKY